MSIEHEASMLGRIMSADEDIVVECRGSTAYAEPGRVVIPSIDTFTALNEENAYTLFQAFIDHEIGHAVDSDLVLWGKLSDEHGAAYHQLHNALEDGYIEGRRGVIYPGARFNLRKKNEWFWTVRLHEGDLTVEERLRDPDSMWSAFLLATAMIVRRDGSRSLEEVQSLNDDLAPLLGMFADDYAEIATLYHQTKQTSAVSKIALRIMERLKELAEAEPEDDEKKSEEESAATEVMQSLEQYTPEGNPLSPEEALQVVVNKVFEQPDDVRPYIVFDPSFDIVRDFSAEDLQTTTDEFDKYAAQASVAADALVCAFEAALRGKREKRITFGGDSGEIDASVLTEYAMGMVSSDDIYLNYAAEDDNSVAVALLIDSSGSMGYEANSASALARLAAIAMGDALHRVQIPYEACGFTTLCSAHLGGHHQHPWARGIERQMRDHFTELRKLLREAEAKGTDLSKFARTAITSEGQLQLPIYGVMKSFDSTDNRGLIHANGISQNLDGEAVLWQARRLAQRPESRRVMIVISDGYPAGSHDNAQGARYLCESIERVIAAGIEVYGLGIKSDAVQHFYPTWWRCNDLDGLVDLAMNVLTEAIASTRMEREWVGVI